MRQVVGVAAALSTACLEPAPADSSAAKPVVSEDFNGIAKGRAEKRGHLDIRRISKPHPDYSDVEADTGPRLSLALEMCE